MRENWIQLNKTLKLIEEFKELIHIIEAVL